LEEETCGLTSVLQATARLRSCFQFYASDAPRLSAGVSAKKMNLRFPASACALAAALLYAGCSPSPQARFAKQLKNADRVLLTKVSATNPAVSASISRTQAQDLCDAVSSATAGAGDTAPPFDSVRMEFFSGTNILGTIIVDEALFWLNNETYKVKTGAVRDLYRRLK